MGSALQERTAASRCAVDFQRHVHQFFVHGECLAQLVGIQHVVAAEDPQQRAAEAEVLVELLRRYGK